MSVNEEYIPFNKSCMVGQEVNYIIDAEGMVETYLRTIQSIKHLSQMVSRLNSNKYLLVNSHN